MKNGLAVIAFMVTALAMGFALAQVTTLPPSTIQPNITTGFSQIPTYAASVTSLVNVSDSDIICVTGSDTKLIRVHGFCASARSDADTVVNISVVLRSSLNTGGGLASVPIVKMDPLNDTATAVVQSFTSAPTYGTALGSIRSKKIGLSAKGSQTSVCEGAFTFPMNWGQPIVLRSATDAACFHASAAGAGGSWSATVEFTEE